MKTVKDFFEQYSEKGHFFVPPLEVFLRNGNAAAVSYVFPRKRGFTWPVIGVKSRNKWRLSGAWAGRNGGHPEDIVAIPSAGIDERVKDKQAEALAELQAIPQEILDTPETLTGTLYQGWWGEYAFICSCNQLERKEESAISRAKNCWSRTEVSQQYGYRTLDAATGQYTSGFIVVGGV